LRPVNGTPRGMYGPMEMAPVSETLRTAVEHHRAGRLADAAELYERIVRVDPRHADAFHLLGVVAHQCGDFGRAAHCIRRAIEANNSFAPYHNNLGAAYRALGRVDEAIASYQEALFRDPDSPGVHYNLGNAFKDKGLFAEAVESYRRALSFDARQADAWNNLGIALRQLERFDEAEISHIRALEIRSVFPEAHFEPRKPPRIICGPPVCVPISSPLTSTSAASTRILANWGPPWPRTTALCGLTLNRPPLDSIVRWPGCAGGISSGDGWSTSGAGSTTATRDTLLNPLGTVLLSAAVKS